MGLVPGRGAMFLYPVRVKYILTFTSLLQRSYIRVRERIVQISVTCCIVKVVETFVTRLWGERKVSLRMTMRVKTMAEIEFFIWVQ